MEPENIHPPYQDALAYPPRNRFQLSFSSSILFAAISKIIKKPFHSKNAQHELLWRDLDACVLSKYKYAAKTREIADADVYADLHKYMNANYYRIYGFPANENAGRSISRLVDIQHIIGYVSPRPFIYKYVDIGCSQGGICGELGRALGCGRENVFGVDILPPEQIKNVDLFQYICVDADATTLPFADSSVCLVTCMMSLHHIFQHADYLREIYRILRPNGLLVIQEHDAQTRDQKIALDILHGLYCLVWCKEGERENPAFCDNYVAYYATRQEWEREIVAAGFAPVALPALPFVSIPKKNIHHNYWAVYVKLSDVSDA